MSAAPWWEAPAGKVHKTLLPYVRAVEQRQSDLLDRLQMYEAMYDPNGPAADQAGESWQRRNRGIKENVIAVSVDTARATIAATEIRARFMTDGGDWGVQRRAKLLEKYAEEIGKLTDVGAACRAAFFACAKKGTGIVRVYADRDNGLRVEPVMVDNIIVDDRECANGSPPRQLHHRQVDFDVDALVHWYPDSKVDILKARDVGARGGWPRRRILAAGETRNDVCVVESIRLPLGTYPPGYEEMSAKEKAATNYVPGRHVICVEGADLHDEEWHKPHFGLAEIRWNEREGSWYGIGLAERIVGHQRVLDERNKQRHRQLEYAVPTTYGSMADPVLKVQRTEAGNYIALKGPPPTTVVPTVVGMEIANDRMDARASAIAEIGLSEMATRGTKPAGIESGAGLREFKDQTGQRFALQEKALEALWLRVVTLILDTCKDLGDEAPKLSRQTRYGTRALPWREVEIDEVRVQIAAASTLARTPAGRVQMVLELSQAGAISLDETRRLLQHPDLEGELSLWTSALEAIEYDLEAIEEGHPVVPEAFTNLKLAADRGTKRYNLVSRQANVPEDVLEGLRTYVVQAIELMTRSTGAPANDAGAPTAGAAPLPPGDVPMPTGPALPPMAAPQQVPSMGPPSLPAGTGPMAA